MLVLRRHIKGMHLIRSVFQDAAEAATGSALDANKTGLVSCLGTCITKPDIYGTRCAVSICL